MKFKIFILFSFLIGSSFIKQTITPLHIKFAEKNSSIEVDGFGNIYTISKNEITKYISTGSLFKKFSIKKYGAINYIDATNPLKILVFYKDFQQIIFLDDQLTQTNSIISLETMGYEQTELVCTSSNNSFWIYNKQNNELIRFDSELKTLVKTGNIKRILNIDIKPNFMKEHNNMLYINCPDEGILVFDIYGTFYKTIPLKNIKEFNVINGDVFYFENRTLKQYQSQTFNTIEKTYSDSLLKNVFWKNQHFYKIYSDSLIVE